MSATQRWLTVMPHVWRGQPAFWDREAGVLCLGFRAVGIDSKLVLTGEPLVSQEVPLVVGTAQQFEDASWWRQFQATGVVLYSWAAPRYEPIARAIKESGTKLVLRLDSDGVCHPRVWFWRFLSNACYEYRDLRKRFSGLAAVLKTLLFRFYPPIFDRRIQQHLAHADLIMIESPVAQQRLLRLLLEWGRKDLADKVRMMPAQIRDEFDYDPAVPKRPQIVAVGRWEATQKDAPLLIRTLARVLEHHADYEAVVAGSGEELLRRLLAKRSPSVRSRIKVLGRIPHEQLRQLYKESQILFFSSRYEGFPNAAAEALCCGCSIVGPALISALNYCASHSSGTLACTRREEDFADALGAEIEAWRSGDRDPREISRHWRPRVSTSAVAARILSAFN